MEPTFSATLADSIEEEKRGVAFSIFSCVSFLPWSMMPFIGGYLIDIHVVLTTIRATYGACMHPMQKLDPNTLALDSSLHNMVLLRSHLHA
jgi:MFS family permease